MESKKKALIIIGSLSNSGAPLTTLHFIEALNHLIDFDVLVLNSKTDNDTARKDEYKKYCKNIYIKNFEPINLIKKPKNRKKTLDYIKNLVSLNNYNYVYSISGLLSIFLFKSLKRSNSTIKTIFYSLGPGAIKRTGHNISSKMVFCFKFNKTIDYMDYIFYISENGVTKKMLNSNKAYELRDYPNINDITMKKAANNNTIGILATISKNKNQLFCIKVLEKLNAHNNYNLIIMGNVVDKMYYSTLLKYISKNGLENYVSFLSGNEDKRVFFNTISYFLLPSKREGLPLVLLESQYCHVPCISSLAAPESANLGGLKRLSLNAGNWADYILKNKEKEFAISNSLEEDFRSVLTNIFNEKDKF